MEEKNWDVREEREIILENLLVDLGDVSKQLEDDSQFWKKSVLNRTITIIKLLRKENELFGKSLLEIAAFARTL